MPGSFAIQTVNKNNNNKKLQLLAHFPIVGLFLFLMVDIIMWPSECYFDCRHDATALYYCTVEFIVMGDEHRATYCICQHSPQFLCPAGEAEGAYCFCLVRPCVCEFVSAFNWGRWTIEDNRVPDCQRVPSWQSCTKLMGDLPKKLEYKQKRDNRGSPIAGKNTHVCVCGRVFLYCITIEDRGTKKQQRNLSWPRTAVFC